MSQVIAVTIPSGFWKEGACYHEAEIRPISAREYLDLADAVDGMLPAHSATALLTRCLSRIGPVQPVSAAHVRSLTVGDREALLLQLHLALNGDRMDALLTCGACGQAMDVPLSVSALLCRPQTPRLDSYEDTFRFDATTVRVCFRAPTGEDQERAAELAQADLDGAEIFLLKRCIVSARRESDGALDDDSSLPDDQEFLAALTSWLCDRIGEIDPQADITLNLSCPYCGHGFQSLFDVGEYIRDDLRRARGRVYSDVHLLALHYHWSEKDILELSQARRSSYLRLLAGAGRA
jgi:hypothetical protein